MLGSILAVFLQAVPVITAPASAGAITPGATSVSGCTSEVLYGNSGAVLACETALSYDDSTNSLSISPGTTVATQSANMVTNGTFTGSATGWTLGGGGGAPDWAYNSNNVTHGNGGGTSTLQPSTPLTIAAGSKYLLKYTISNYVAGTVTASVGGTSGAAVTFNTSMTEIIVATNTNNLLFTPTTTLDATIDTVELYLITEVSSAISLLNGGGTFPTEMRQSGTGQANAFFGDDNGSVAQATAIANTGFGANALLAISTGTDNTAVGASALRENAVGVRNTAFGRSALRRVRTGTDHVGVGYLSGQNLLNGVGMTCIGTNTCQQTTGSDYSIVLGFGAETTAANQFVVGGTGANTGFSEAYLGHGVAKATPYSGQAVTLFGSSGTGSNNAGTDLALSPGRGTGTAIGGDLRLQRSPSIATGSTLQSVADSFIVRSQYKTLTPATATAFLRLNLAPAVAGIEGWCGGTVFNTIIANTAAAAVVQTYVTSVNFACHNLAGAETCAFGTISSAADNTPTGTITAPTYDANAGTSTIDLRISTDSDQTETTLAMFYSAIINGTCTATPQ